MLYMELQISYVENVCYLFCLFLASINSQESSNN